MNEGPPRRHNPFDGWKANFLTEEEVERTWVTPPEQIEALAEPTSRLPTYVTGGKGSGKTHLMRWLSYPVQKLRADGSVLDAVQHDGFVGVWVLLGGFNSSRFSGKGLTDEEWRPFYSYSMELWLARATLGVYDDLLRGAAAYEGCEPELCARVANLFDSWPGAVPEDVGQLNDQLAALQKQIDFAVNNLGVATDWAEGAPVVHATAPALTFGIPEVLVEVVPSLRAVRTLYLVDELENLHTRAHQMYVNTLVREHRGPTSLKIGTRLYGRLTEETYSGERNRVGSEFDEVNLDNYLMTPDRPADYGRFCRQVLARRLLEAQGADYDAKGLDFRADHLDADFEDPQRTQDERIMKALARRAERPYFSKLLRQLGEYAALVDELGVPRDAHATLVDRLRVPNDAMVEKANVLLLYRAWSTGRNLMDAAVGIAEDAVAYLERSKRTKQHTVLSYFKADLQAQLLRELRLEQPYQGLQTIIDLSGGLPRYLLVIMKHAYQAGVFRGENPFDDGPLSIDAQASAVRNSVRLFREDAVPPGELGQTAANGIDNLANLFQSMRFSDKPPESSLRAFTADLERATPMAQEVVRISTQWSLLRPVDADRSGRNTGERERAFELHRMLSPHYNLPLGRRGVIDLTAEEINALFDPAHHLEFEALRDRRLARINVPFGRSAGRLPGIS